MKTKNLFGWFAMAAMLVGTGCSTDEVVNNYSEDNAIEFGTYVGRNAVSRATVIDNQKLGTDGFGVFAYHTKTDDFVPTTTEASEGTEAAAASAPDFMYNQKVENKTWDETSKQFTDAWTYEPLKYWPNNTGDKVSFFAYAPYDAGTNSNFTFNEDAGLPTLNFTVNTDVKRQQDLLWADPQMNLTKATDHASINGTVNFEFHHALAKIGFQVQTMIDKVNADDVNSSGNEADNETKTEGEGESETTVPDNGENLDGQTTVIVKKVTLSGKFIPSGTLSYTPNDESKYVASITGDASSEDVSYVLSASSTDADNNLYNATSITLPTATEAEEGDDEEESATGYTGFGQSVNQTEAQLNAEDSYIMIIPKEFTGEDKLKITVEYDVVTVDSKLADDVSAVENNIASSFTGISFEAGKQYTFSLHLGLTSVKLAATVNDWINGTDYAVNVPLNIADPQKED